jgi:5'(3')-deoxyribonucleotidase
MLKKQRILLDMDGVLVDFLGGALKALNRVHKQNITIEEYATKFGKWETYDYYGISISDFWMSIGLVPDFWYELEPIPWFRELYDFLKEFGEVTILTSPNYDPSCAEQKLRWLNSRMNIRSDSVFIGSRKYLMAGNGILIDDYSKNIEAFREAGGEAILVPSTWNTAGLTFEDVKNAILGRK